MLKYQYNHCSLDSRIKNKILLMILIEHFLDECQKEKLLKLQCINQLVPICKKLTDDGNAEVRTKVIMLLAKTSVQLYNGSIAVDLKGDKFTKYQAQVNIYLEGIKALQGNNTSILIPYKSNFQSNKENIQNQAVVNPKPEINANKQQQIAQSQVNQECQEIKYQATMTPNQVEAFFKQYKSKYKDQSDLGNILLAITQQSKQILTFTMDYIVDKIGDQKSLCYQLFEKCLQSYKPNHITQLITSFKNATTQAQLIEVLTLLLKYIPLSEKTIDQQLISDFLKGNLFQMGLFNFLVQGKYTVTNRNHHVIFIPDFITQAQLIRIINCIILSENDDTLIYKKWNAKIGVKNTTFAYEFII